MDLNQFSESNYMSKDDVPEEPGTVLQIDKFSIEEMRDGEKKPALHWVEDTHKPLLLNTTNRNRLLAIFGTSETGDLVGRKVRVYNDPLVEFGGKIVGGCRIGKVQPEVSDEIPGI